MIWPVNSPFSPSVRPVNSPTWPVNPSNLAAQPLKSVGQFLLGSELSPERRKLTAHLLAEPHDLRFDRRHPS